MLMKKFNKILLIIMTLIVAFCLSFAYAGGTPYQQVSDGTTMITSGTDDVSKSLQTIVNVLLWVAFALSIIKLAQIGFQFMLSAGKKSKAKESLIPWAIGVFVCGTFLMIGPWIMKLLTEGLSADPFDVGI